MFAASRSKVVGVVEVQRWAEQLRTPTEDVNAGVVTSTQPGGAIY